MSKPANLLGRLTRKVYYEDNWRTSLEARVVRVKDRSVELEGTIAFPEGGGQEGDRGTIELPGGAVVRFVDTQKKYGRPLFITDFPVINVDTIVDHVVAEEDGAQLASLQAGDMVRLRIDIERRAGLTLSHTASHLIYMAVNRIRPDAIGEIRGCHIKEDSARFDFGTSERFTPEQVAQIAECATELALRDLAVEVYPHPDEPEALYWRCDGVVIPCGGTHLASTGAVGPLEVRRRNLGKGLERLTAVFPDRQLDLRPYHD